MFLRAMMSSSNLRLCGPIQRALELVQLDEAGEGDSGWKTPSGNYVVTGYKMPCARR